MLPVIELFGTYISTYALAALAGCALAAALFMLCTRRSRGISAFDGAMLFIAAVIGGLIGAKLLYIIVELKDILADGDFLRRLTGGGFVFYGGLAGGMLAALLYCRINTVDFIGFADALCAPLCFGHAVGRVGCFLAGCCYGCETSLAIGVVYPEGSIPPAGVKLLPTQLMEAAFLLLLGIALLIVLKRCARLYASAAYLLSYGIWRFVIEFFRADPRGGIGLLSTSQIISIFAAALGIFALIRARAYADNKTA